MSLPIPTPTAARKAKALSFLIDPFDILLHSEEEALYTLQAKFSAWLQGQSEAVRLVTWHVPTSLQELIDWTIQLASESEDPWRRARLMEYRRFYESLDQASSYQRAICGFTLWTEENQQSRSVALAAASSFDTFVHESPWPPLAVGQYELRRSPHFWHLAPVGRPGGRPLLCFMTSYMFRPVEWTFFRPLAMLFGMGIPVALAVDVPKTWDTAGALSRLEGVVNAYYTHLMTSSGRDSAGEKRVVDVEMTLADINAGQSLHEVQFVLALAGRDIDTLKERRDEVINRLKPFMGLRHEVGVDQRNAAKFFSMTPTKQIGIMSTWPMTSDQAALTMGFLGIRKLESMTGIMRGEAVGGGYPVLHDSWKDRRATHEIWVGLTGTGKTFGLNAYLSREFAHNNIAFDLLEPMGHGELLAKAFGLQAYTMSAHETCLNPQDVMYLRIGEQIAHVIRIYETVLQRPLGGDQRGNLERALLGQALEYFYSKLGSLDGIDPEDAPLTEDMCSHLSTLGDKPHIQQIAKDLADEIGGLCTGNGPWSSFLNGHTSVDFSLKGSTSPRIFCYHKLEEDPIMVALAYTQTIAALMRDAMKDETPRIVAVDEVWRMMRHPSLLKFLITAVKTLRTRRKKVIVIDQQMSIFLDGEARLIFENCPIRVIFNQRGSNDFVEDPAFDHYTDQHREIIRSLPRFHFVLDIMDEGIYYLYNRASPAELARFGRS